MRVTRDRKCKYISTPYYAKPYEWDAEQGRFLCNKKIAPDYKSLDSRLSELEVCVNDAIRAFETDQIGRAHV